MAGSKLPDDDAAGDVSAALASLAQCFRKVSPVRQAELAGIARQLTAMRERVAHAADLVPAHEPATHETDDDRLAREDAASARRIDVMLARLCLSELERQFAENVGERIVELVSDAYVQATAGTDRYDPACITAAVTVALMVVYDPPDGEGPTGP